MRSSLQPHGRGRPCCRDVECLIGPKRAQIHCQLYHAVVIELVSANRLPKTGISAVWAGDFRHFLAKVADFRRPETLGNRTKTLEYAGYSTIMAPLSPVE
jgi:hypothetical protein